MQHSNDSSLSTHNDRAHSGSTLTSIVHRGRVMSSCLLIRKGVDLHSCGGPAVMHASAGTCTHELGRVRIKRFASVLCHVAEWHCIARRSIALPLTALRLAFSHKNAYREKTSTHRCDKLPKLRHSCVLSQKLRPDVPPHRGTAAWYYFDTPLCDKNNPIA